MHIRKTCFINCFSMSAAWSQTLRHPHFKQLTWPKSTLLPSSVHVFTVFHLEINTLSAAFLSICTWGRAAVVGCALHARGKDCTKLVFKQPATQKSAEKNQGNIIGSESRSPSSCQQDLMMSGHSAWAWKKPCVFQDYFCFGFKPGLNFLPLCSWKTLPYEVFHSK